MLVLTRRVGESIWVGEDIEIVVLEISGKQVKLGTTAPKAMVVLRGELRDRLEIADRVIKE